MQNRATYFIFYENLFLIAIGSVPLLHKIRTDLGSPIVKKITCFALPASHNLREPNSEYLYVELMWLGNLLAKKVFFGLEVIGENHPYHSGSDLGNDGYIYTEYVI